MTLSEPITFDEIHEGTRVTLVHVELPDAGGGATRHEGGWQSILRKCHDALRNEERPVL